MTAIISHADYHRNGIGGAGFHVAIVTDPTEDALGRFLIVTFQNDDGGDSEYTAALNLDEAHAGNIYMHPQGDQPGGNAWRGDRIAEAVNDKIISHVRARYDA